MAKSVRIELLLDDKMSPGVDKGEKKLNDLKGTAGISNAELEKVRQSVIGLQKEIALLEARRDSLQHKGSLLPNMNQEKNIAEVQALERHIAELKNQLKELQSASATTVMTPPDLPNAQKSFNGLNMSIQQIAREMPSLAMGPQMFFLAISNNLPIFADEVARAKQEYKALTAAGQKGVPVWKQILSSLFSWQTAMTTGIMLLVMYGKEIGEWISSIFSADDALKEFNITAGEMVEIEKTANATMVKTRFEIDKTISSIKNFKGSKEEEKNKVDELNQKYGESFGYYETLAQWYDILTKKGNDYIDMLFLQAKSQSMINKAIEADEEYNKIKAQKPEEAEGAMGFFGKMGQYMVQGMMARDGYKYDADKVIAEENQKNYDTLLTNAKKKVDGYIAEAKRLSKDAEKIGKDKKIGGYVKPSPPKTVKKDSRVNYETRIGRYLLSLRKDNDKAELDLMEDGRQKRLKQIETEFKERKATIAAQAAAMAAENKKAGKGYDLTEEQRNEINRANELADKQHQQRTADVYKSEFDDMQDYLKNYGTFQQQKLAIAEEYAEKISRAGSDAERKSLTAERDSKLADVSAREFKMNIDWRVVFGEFGGMFDDLVRPVLKEIQDYVSSDEFANADHESQEAVIDAMHEMERALGGADKVSFEKLGNEINAYKNDLQTLAASQKRYAEAYKNLMTATKRYNKAMESGTEAEQLAAAATLNITRERFENAEKETAADKENAEKARRTVTTTAETLQNSMAGVTEGLRQMSSGSISGAFNGLSTFAKGMDQIEGMPEVFGKLAKTLDDLPIVGMIAGVLDVLKDGIADVLQGILDAVFSAVNAILEDVLQGRIFTQMGKSLIKGVGSLFNTITFGGFKSWTTSSNAAEVQRTIDRLTDRNEKLQTSIESLTEEVKKGRGTKSVEAYREARKNQKEQNANYLDIARAQAGYHGAHHSWNYYWDGFTDEQLAWIRQNVNADFNGDLFSLTPEEMKKLRANVAIWEEIQNAGKGGYGDRLAEKLDDYIDQAGKMEELTNELYEGLTGMSFDSMYDSFVDKLMDMKYSAKDAADDISEMFMKAMLSNKIGELYADKLKEWWEKFGKAMEDNDLTDEEREALANEYLRFVEDAAKLRDELAEVTGYKGTAGTTQSAKAGGFNAMSQDQGNKLDGMFTSGLQHWSNIDKNIENVADKMNSAENHLAKIEQNTGMSAKHLDDIKGEIKKIIRDGLKMK